LAGEAVAAFPQNQSLAECVDADDSGGVGHVPRPRGYGPCVLDFGLFADSTTAFVYIHVAVIVRLLQPRSDRNPLKQQ
jgi:hypothetical protein